MGRHLGKLVNMHALNLASTRCGAWHRWLLLVFDLLWCMCIAQFRQ